MKDSRFKNTASRSRLPNVSRRQILSTGVSVMTLPALAAFSGQAVAEPPRSETVPQAGYIDLTVNGRRQQMAADTRLTLLDALRDHLGLIGSKKGCDHGQCGACTVMVGDRRVLSCLTLAVSVREPVTTIEGLMSADGNLHPMQQAFIDQDAFQCGYCTPGQIMSAVACIKEGHAGSAAEIREFMSGNLCRCAAYPNIVKAVQQAKTAMSPA